MKSLKILTSVILLLAVTIFANGQVQESGLNTTLKKNSANITLGGMGMGGSVNYGRNFMIKDSYFLNVSAGMGTLPFVGGTTIPHQITFNIGKQSSFFEIGLGGTYWSGKSNSSGYTESINSYHLSTIIGWEKIFGNNLIFKVYTNPLIRVFRSLLYRKLSGCSLLRTKPWI